MSKKAGMIIGGLALGAVTAAVTVATVQDLKNEKKAQNYKNIKI